MSDLPELARRIGADVTGPTAGGHDRAGSFPAETVAALREAGLLSLGVPVEVGGRHADVLDIARLIGTLSGFDASVGIVLVMHYSQVQVLARHGRTPAVGRFLREVHDDQLLLANANSEVTVAGTDRSSRSHVEARPDGTFRVEKASPVISYAGDADAILVTARRDRDADPTDQVVAICRAADITLTPTGEWDSLGLRATGSRPWHLVATGSCDLVLAEPYHQIVDATGLPVTNVLFGEMWLGMATAATATAHRYARKRGRPSEALAELAGVLDQLRGLVQGVSARFASIDGTPAAADLGFVRQLQSLKVVGSRLLIDIVARSLAICGVAGYRNDSPYALGQALRDAYGCALMVSNEAVLGQNAQLLQVLKEI